MRLADGLDLPADAATQVIAFLGRRGMGKTYAAGRLVEQLHAAHHQVVILDPVGVWWGLRLAKDGKEPGIPIPVFGGEHGDIPLEATAGAVIARLVAERRPSLVLDVSSFTAGEQRRFVADFATELFQAKKKHRSAVFVLLEEVQEFAPQNATGEVARMLGAIQRLAKLGRNYGVGLGLLSQRPQEVNKAVLNLAELMLCFQLTGPQERKTMQGWVQERGAEGREDVSGELPSLPKGTALVWSPEWLKVYGRYHVLPKWTYDASATPTARVEAAGDLAPVDLREVQKAMAATIEKAAESDPKALREEVARLRRENLAARTMLDARPAAPPPPPRPVPYVPPAVLEGLRAAHGTALALTARLGEIVEEAYAFQDAAAPPVPAARPLARVPSRSTERRVEVQRTGNLDFNVPARAAALADASSGTERRMLVALAGAGGHLSKRQLATLAVVSPTKSTFRGAVARLKQAGHIEVTGDIVAITAAGRAEVRDVRPPSDRRELLAMWRDKMQGKAKDALELFATQHGPFTIQAIADEIGVDRKLSTFRGIMAQLRGNGLVRKVAGGLAVAEELAL